MSGGVLVNVGRTGRNGLWTRRAACWLVALLVGIFLDDGGMGVAGAVPVGGLTEANYVESARDLDLGMVWIPGGTYVVGRRQGIPEVEIAVRWGSWGCSSEAPPRRRELNGYWIGETEITVGQFRTFVEATGYVTQAERAGYTRPRFAGARIQGASWRDPGWPQTDEYPVVCLSFEDALAFVAWLREETGHAYTLPTEAQREVASGAGGEGMWHFGNNVDDIDAYAWHSGISEQQSHPVRSKLPNAWGLYGMLANALEPAASPFTPNHDAPPNQAPDAALEEMSSCMTKGGCFWYAIHWTRTAERHVHGRTQSHISQGFRVARIPREGESPVVTLDAYLYGKLTIDGIAWDPDVYDVSLAPLTGRVPIYPIQPDGRGGFEVDAKPGKYVVSLRGGDMRLLMDGSTVVTLESGAQEQDIALHRTTPRLRGVPEGDFPQRYSVMAVYIQLPEGEERYLFSDEHAPGQYESMVTLLPGTYRFDYQSHLYETPEAKGVFEIGPDSSSETFEVPAVSKPMGYVYRKLPLGPGTYQYRIVYSDHHAVYEQRLDPDNPRVVTLPDGSKANEFSIPGGAVGPDGTRAPWPKVDDEEGVVQFRYLTHEQNDIWVAGSFNNWEQRNHALGTPDFTMP